MYRDNLIKIQVQYIGKNNEMVSNYEKNGDPQKTV